MNNQKIKKTYRSIMLVIVVSLITFVLTSVCLYNKLGMSNYANNISLTNTELVKKIYAIKAILDSKYISEINEENLEISLDRIFNILTSLQLVLSIFLILPFIIVGVVLENSHISSNFLFNDSSIGNSSLIIFTIILSFLYRIVS